LLKIVGATIAPGANAMAANKNAANTKRVTLLRRKASATSPTYTVERKFAYQRC
jgi:hypothetical protein